MTGGYGVRSESDLIDVNTIQSGINNFMNALSELDNCGNSIIEASETCSKKALSVDDVSYEAKIAEIGMELKEVVKAYAAYIEELGGCVNTVLNDQVNELNTYINWLNQQQANESVGQ